MRYNIMDTTTAVISPKQYVNEPLNIKQLGPLEIIRAYVAVRNLYVEWDLMNLIRELGMCLTREEYEQIFREACNCYKTSKEIQ